MKKLITVLTSFALCACMLPLQIIHAEDPAYTDSEYWNNYCSDAENSTTSACDAYRDYLKSVKSDLASKLTDAKTLREQYEADAATAKAQVAAYQTQIDEKQSQINAVQAEIDNLQTQIDAKQKEIDAKQAEIAATQAKIDTISTKIKQRMVNEQSSLKINKYLDILMGASTLQDWLRIVSGLKAISESDKNSSDELVTMREQLSTQKTELQKAQDEIKATQAEQQAQKDELSTAQQELITYQANAQAAAELASELTAQQLALEDNISANIDSIKATLSQVAAQNGVPETSEGWTYPVPGAYKSAGTWNYPGGSIHLGYDFAASLGTPIVAAANGLIIASANGCGYGSLGDGCGKAQGGLWGGGNQVYELAVVGDSLYALIYAHMLINTPIATGTYVSAGDQIGQLGSSGNSTGPHCHVEVTYLGAASDFSSWLAGWNGDLGFGCGWAGSYDGYGRRCEAGYSAPCRIRPETVFGG